ncbi:MAG: hypothetical protein A3D65_05145 [Candidatus Lloydbacteria bacterium RIFCSPHIGHO2_02_FULL_50_13]|uniref:Beta-lactamase class A catalytic domain-containing protein n=1 Tax=Candidatus Lloydbacteria bacterium RIFCSPHIGHO2_02_FULL_50_13 TaxID=1798661 RepID=A0A1G2D5A8_9BACT|nr:MAG: hypothetical protein A3D65_05145 [Candidatus Lloydbacteria bacterium RIFCSPHIGHO2_02_FULL_50_13]
MSNASDIARAKQKNLIYLIVAALGIAMTILFAGLFFWSQCPSAIQSFENPYPLIDPARSFIAQEHFLTSIETLRKELKDIVARYEDEGDRIGVYFEYLNTGANVSINHDKRFWPASLSKMPTALAVMKKVEKGEWELSNELVLFYEDRDDGFGELYKKPAGTRLTIEELLRELIINSDDTAHRILIRNLEGLDFEDMLLALGMEELYNRDYDITAKEYSRIFRSLYVSSYLKREYSTYLLELLKSTSFDEFLTSGIASGVPFSHKIGEHDPERTYLDSGIVYVANRPYLITAMVKVGEGKDKKRAKEIMKALSQTAYNYVANY